jgi:hypothetical protein
MANSSSNTMYRNVVSILTNQTYGRGGGNGTISPWKKKWKTSNRATVCSSWILLFNVLQTITDLHSASCSLHFISVLASRKSQCLLQTGYAIFRFSEPVWGALFLELHTNAKKKTSPRIASVIRKSVSFHLNTHQKFHRRHQYNSRYEPDGSGFETPIAGWRRDLPYPPRTVLRPTQYAIW